MKIFIPTVGRTQKQITAEQLRAAGLEYTLVANGPEGKKEAKLLKSAGHDAVASGTTGIRATRQWILDKVKDKVLMIDDDLQFWTRSVDGKKFTKSTPDELRLMVDTIQVNLNDFAHGGIVEKFMSQARPRTAVFGGRYFQVLAYNKALFPKPYPKMRVEIGEDHDMNLQLLKAGKRSFILTEWSKTDKEWAPGGCCLMGRNEETLEIESKKLAALHPDVVEIKEPKPGKHSTLRINWRKAQEIGGLR